MAQSRDARCASCAAAAQAAHPLLLLLAHASGLAEARGLLGWRLHVRAAGLEPLPDPLLKHASLALDRRNGGALLLDAAAALGCTDDRLEVKAAACMSKCPNRDVVLRGADGAITVSASGLESAVEAAAEWLEQSGVRTTAAVRQGFAAKVKGEEALRSGEAQQAVERFGAALAAAPAEIASMVAHAEPNPNPNPDPHPHPHPHHNPHSHRSPNPKPNQVAHAPPEDEPLVWDESEWHQEALGGGGLLSFAESCFTYEYATCGGAVLTNCALLDEETATLTLTLTLTRTRTRTPTPAGAAGRPNPGHNPSPSPSPGPGPSPSLSPSPSPKP